MTVQHPIVSFLRIAVTVGAVALTGGCAMQASDGAGDESGDDTPRFPIGKADGTGSCTSNGQKLCGGKSKGTCWCDEKCEQYGDCCSDKGSVCLGLPLDVSSIDTASTFDAIAFKGQDGLVIGKSIKFLIDNRKPTAPVVHFMNANYTGSDASADAKKYHFFFGQKVVPGFSDTLSTFDDVTYWTQDKRYFAGTIQEYDFGADQKPLYAIQFYPQDVIAETTVVKAAKVIVGKFKIPGTRMGFVATGPQQTTSAAVASQLGAIGVENLSLDQVFGSLKYIPMQLGDAYGYLRIFPQNQELLSALDIPVFDELPLDLTVVAGTITKAVQDASSHINLKSKERGTPNMVLRDAAPNNEKLAPFADKPIHLVVAADGFHILKSTDAEVKQKLKERLNKPWQKLNVNASAKLTSYRDMCPSNPGDCVKLSSSFGNKAGNLGFLIHPKVLGTKTDSGSLSQKLGYDIAPPGVGVPVHGYIDFINLPANGAARTAVKTLIDKETAGTLSSAERSDLVKKAQAAILASQLPPGFVDAIVAKVKQALPATAVSVKIRSSANAEDIAGFDAAGLYDSFRADFDKPDTGACAVAPDPEDGDLETKPKSFACAIKAVYASLWNKRAVEERSFARVDHATAAMGLSIVERYKDSADIAANSVVITRALNAGGIYGYTFSSQMGDNVVTNPLPGTLSEGIIAAFLPGEPPTFSVTRYAKPDPAAAPLDHTVMSDVQMKQLLQITQSVELAYCQAKPGYYDGPCENSIWDVDKPTALDFELKLYVDGRFLCKQVREFSGK